MRPRTGATGQPLTRRRSDLGVLLGGLTLLVICSIPASSGRVGSLEQQLFEAVNGLSDAMEPPAHAAQFLGAHNPLNVIGGLGMGVAIGGAINLALRVPSTAGSIGP